MLTNRLTSPARCGARSIRFPLDERQALDWAHRLALYEDTGLTPAEVGEMAKRIERLEHDALRDEVLLLDRDSANSKLKDDLSVNKRVALALQMENSQLKKQVQEAAEVAEYDHLTAEDIRKAADLLQPKWEKACSHRHANGSPALTRDAGYYPDGDIFLCQYCGATGDIDELLDAGKKSK